ncbi:MULTISPECIES: universal stress protein [Myxococcaceae]|uniref:universal stress protein n=1 Tax=Myxococcaceae TaxID=31 RepID=UPI00188EEAA4|nr:MULTISPECIES: universal stress protein [Myxococcaceae]MBF5045736.1 universal stress protein [Simulacricoccus sp. 17bor-14]
MTMKRILVCVDGSEASGRALELAVKLARLEGAQVAVTHVAPPAVHPLEGDVGAVVEPAPELPESVLAQRAAERAKALGAPDAVWSVLSGEAPAEALARAAEAQDCDLVAVGSRGQGALARALLGSTSSQLVKLCRRPVLVVH